MNDNIQQPEQTDDVEAHVFRAGKMVPQDGDTEGHAIRSGRIIEDEDTEGHGTRAKV